MSSAAPSPALFFDTVNAYQRTEALKAALELEVFTAIAEGKHTVADIARRTIAAERGIRILCDFLVICGLLTKDAEGRYGLTQDSAVFLDKRSPAYLGTTVEFLLSPLLIDGFRDIGKAVRKGGTVLPEQGSVTPDNPVWVNFARSMAPMAAPAAEDIAELIGARAGGKWKVLDIAAGHGLYGIAIGRHNPNAEVAALDWPNVLTVAAENARAAGVEKRFRTIPGNAFDSEFGEGYDIVLITNFLHHFDPPACETLLRKVHRALAPGGRAVTLEFVPAKDRVTPPMAAAFAMIMLANTPSGDAYTFEELERMARNAGFARSEMHSLAHSVENAIVSFK